MMGGGYLGTIASCLLLLLLQLSHASVVAQDAAAKAWSKQFASRDISRSLVQQYRSPDGTKERALFVDTETQNVTVAPGDRAVLTCRVQQLGIATVAWRRQGDTHPLTIGLFTFAQDPRISVDHDHRTDEWYLIIQDVMPQDEGVYHCQVTMRDDPNNMHNVHLYVATRGDCDIEVVSSTTHRNGSITSPGFPSVYPSDTDCRFTLQPNTHAAERVQLVFTEFDLHYPIGDPREPYYCEGVDSLTVSVQLGDDQRFRDIGVYCGSRRPPMIMSAGGDLQLTFSSTSSPTHQSRGFEVSYHFITDFGIKSGEREPDESTDCRFVYRSAVSANGSFTSPNFPGLYPRHATCHYLFYANDDQRVFISFQYFDVDGIEPGCSSYSQSDLVEVSNYDLPHADPIMPRLCGSGVPLRTFRSDANFFRVSFYSNDVYEATGFHATYQFRSIRLP